MKRVAPRCGLRWPARENRPVSAPWLIVVASFLFATMGVCVKLASAEYSSGEIVFYRGLTGLADGKTSGNSYGAQVEVWF